MATTITSPVSTQSLSSRLRDYYTLTKPEVNLLILMTTSAGYYLGSGRGFHAAGLMHTVLGTLLVASGTATLNQWMERAWDGQMRRTASRPLPAGRMPATHALVFGIFLSLAGGLYLQLLVNTLASLLAMSTLLSYLLIYTPLKRRTPLCTLLGAFPGAMPTLIGWAGACGAIHRQAWLLFAVLFLWQFPHFLAIALMYHEDYDRAGYRMLPRFDSDAVFTRAEIIVFTVALAVTTMLPMVSAGKPGYSIAMAASAGFFLYYCLQLVGSGPKLRTMAARVVHASVIYLPVALGILVASKALRR